MRTMATMNPKPESPIIKYGPTLITGMLYGWMVMSAALRGVPA